MAKPFVETAKLINEIMHYQIKTSSEKLLNVQREILRHGGDITIPHVNFKGVTAHWHYDDFNEILNLHFTKKPFYLTWTMIDEILTEIFE